MGRWRHYQIEHAHRLGLVTAPIDDPPFSLRRKEKELNYNRFRKFHA
jgi:hypothetical protein